MKNAKATPATIDDYISGFPKDVQTILRQIRTTIRKAAPRAKESISYRIPTYKLEGPLVYFAAFKSHIGMYPMTGATRTKFEKELSKYEGGKGTVRFPLDRPIPHALIGRMVKFKVRENAERAKGRAKK